MRNWEIHERVDPDNKATYYLYRTHLDRYEEHSSLSEGVIVVDIGCGYGYGTFALHRHASYAVGIDSSREAIRKAKSRYSGMNLDYALMSAERLAFKRGSLNGAYAFEVIEHLSDPDSFLSEIEGVLDASGFLILSTPNRLASIEKNPFHNREFSWDELDYSLRKHFGSVTMEGRAHSHLFSGVMSVRRLIPSDMVDRLKRNRAFETFIDKIGRQTVSRGDQTSPSLMARCKDPYDKMS